MDLVQILDLGEQYLLFLSQYTLTLVKQHKRVLRISSEERLLAFKVVALDCPLRDKSMHQVLIVLVDEFMGWIIYGIKRTKELALKSVVEVASWKLFPNLFGEFTTLTNKERKQLRCFINCHQKCNQVTIEIHPSKSSRLYLITVNTSQESLKISSKIVVIDAPAFKFGCQGKQVVHSVNFNRNTGFADQISILKNVVLFSKILCVVDQNGVYQIYSLLIDDQYHLSSGDIVVTGIQDQPTGVYMYQSQLLVFLKSKTLTLDTKTNKTTTYQTRGNPFINKGRILLTSNNKLTQLLLQNPLDFKEVRTGLPDSLLVIPVEQLIYSVSRNTSLDLLRLSGKQYSSSVVVPSSSQRIQKAIHHRDFFSSVLQLHKINKVTGQFIRVEYYSNQPHLQQIVSYNHNIDFKGGRLIYVLDSPLLILTNEEVGTTFIQTQVSAGDVSIINSGLYSEFETGEQTLHFSSKHNLTIQVTPTKVLVKQGNSKIVNIPVRDLFEGLDITIDQSIRMGNLVLLAVQSQIHLFQFKNPRNPNRKFIYCFDDQIEYLSCVNTTQTVLIKFVCSNQLNIFFIDYARQAFVLLKAINQEEQLSIIRTYTLPVKIDTVDYCVSIVVHNGHPLLFLVPNDQYIKEKEKISVDYYPLTFVAPRMTPVISDSQKYTFIAQDKYVQFPKSCVLQGQKLPITCTKILNSNMRNIVYAQSIDKNVCLRVGQDQIALYKQDSGKFISQQMVTIPVDKYRCEVVFGQGKEVSAMRLIGHGICQGVDSQFKGREIDKVISQVGFSEDFPCTVGLFNLPFRASSIKIIKSGLYVIYSNQQIWLCRFLVQEKTFYLSVLSKFHYDNQQFINMKNRLPPEDYEDQQFLVEFNKICKFSGIEMLKVEDNYCQLVVSYPALLLILEVHNMVFKVQQVIKLEESVESILDNFESGKAYLKTRNTLSLIHKPHSKYQLLQVQELQQDIVLATEVTNWDSRARIVRLGSSIPQSHTHSRMFVKSIGQLCIQLRDNKGFTSQKEVYV